MASRNLVVAGLLALSAAPAEGQVLIRVGEPARATVDA